ncbi:MAG: hypothetical protein A2847_02705 [Candidatus Sungbacteria bacterium RIFCSPHIGHO2_01_FULL_50_25]|uniref:Uncharacterized protein n=1 Tax=Candidatus Sungbacteria bacterium RIFCSPHIGHO2_01_FULL_50_25 TaxID=1802265 RepID=A0A1G2KBN9_9BACT|nr:MAG: hypothetical protein A2847_02705 [Candidatus Sungbacteria bacterium RIFCSPHIGHO2_01_FULL_50_25]
MRRASRDFFRAVFNEARTMEARTPIIAITTRSSISVNPTLRLRLFLKIDFNIKEYLSVNKLESTKKIKKDSTVLSDTYDILYPPA